MNPAYIYQIYYSGKTFAELDPAFIPLDNTANPRPDWMGYWSIRNHLINNALDEGSFYAFFSPKFGERTGIAGSQAMDFVQHAEANVDVVAFSPFADQSAFFANVIEQGELHHAGLTELAIDFFAEIGQPLDVNALITNSTNTIFCNYFAAKPRFWRVWLDLCERIFALAEKGSSPIGQKLNALTKHSSPTPIKVFLIERMASLILATQPGWIVRTYNPYLLPLTNSPISGFPLEILACDALKIAYQATGFTQYLDALRLLQQRVSEAIQNAVEKNAEQEEVGAGDGNRTHGSSLGS